MPVLQAQFMAAYPRGIERAYPARTEDKWLLALPRRFIVARQRDH